MYLTVTSQKVFAYTANRAFDAGKPTVVFLHGAANDHSVWALQSRYFAYHGWNTLAVDLPGHGKSAGKAMDSISGLADWLMSLLDAAGAKSAALVGHSMGSLIALEFAARFPARVAKIALVGAAVPMPVSPALLGASQANDHLAYEMINAFAHSAPAQLGGNQVPGAWMMGSSMRLMERSDEGVLFADFTACNSYSSGWGAAAKVRCPTLLILGKRDLMTPMKAGAELAGKIAGARTVTLEGAGHALMAEKPDEVLDALRQHFGA